MVPVSLIYWTSWRILSNAMRHTFINQDISQNFIITTHCCFPFPECAKCYSTLTFQDEFYDF